MPEHIEFISQARNSKLIVGTGLSGYVKCSRAHLEALFGPPLPDDCIDTYKTSYEWHVHVKHDGHEIGAVAIYDYKSDHSDDIGEEIHWHIGSKTNSLALEVTEFINTGNKHLQQINS